jgi:hypothetical protein
LDAGTLSAVLEEVSDVILERGRCREAQILVYEPKEYFEVGPELLVEVGLWDFNGHRLSVRPLGASSWNFMGGCPERL